jgi:diguanylate cyclase (GGDEF)-like protein
MERLQLVGLELVRLQLVGEQLVGELVVGVELVREQLVRRLLGVPTPAEDPLHGEGVLRRQGLELQVGRLMSRRSLGVSALTATIAAAAATLWAVAPKGAPILTTSTHVPWWLVAGLFYLAEANVVHIYLRGEAHTFSLSEVPLVLGLFFLSPTALVAAYVVGAGAALLVIRRQRVRKLLFNLSQFALAAILAAIVFRSLLPAGRPGPEAWPPALAAALTSALVGILAVQVVIAVSQGRPAREQVTDVVALGGVATVVNASLGVIAVNLVWDRPTSAWVLLVPVAVVMVAYRAYLAEREKRRGLQFLYESTQILQRAAEVDEAATLLLRHACEMLRAESAELVLFPGGDGSRALRATVDVRGTVSRLAPAELDPGELVLASLASDRQGLLLRDGRPVQSRRRPLRRPAVSEMVAPLEGERGPTGTFRARNRLDEVSSFGAEDLRLLQTLASHMGAALENGQLEQSLRDLRAQRDVLRRQALHDPLTGLANRTLFADRVATALDTASASVAVIYVDLDDFKQVNDTLGHYAGDQVLAAVAERVRACLRPSDIAARLGGDEFAVLLADVPGQQEAARVAARIHEALRLPVFVGQHEIAVGASLGIALGQAASVGPEELLARADAAMYRVKGQGKGGAELAQVQGSDERSDQ